MCGCGMGGNNGNIESPDTPMMVIGNIFGGDIDSMDESGLNDSDSISTSTSTGAVINDND
jgi:hypothetical protein